MIEISLTLAFTTDGSLKHLGRLSQLQTLPLGATGATDAGREGLWTILPQLRPSNQKPDGASLTRDMDVFLRVPLLAGPPECAFPLVWLLNAEPGFRVMCPQRRGACYSAVRDSV